MKEKWLVMSNCQTFGLASSLALLCPHIHVDICDIFSLYTHTQVWKDKFPEYSRLIVNPEMQGDGHVDFSIMPNVTWVPGLAFAGFHPDLLYIRLDGKPIKSPMDDYHSLLIYCSFKLGFDQIKTRKLFCEETYKKIGYYTRWDEESRELIDLFMPFGIDLRSDLVKWMRKGNFMHSVNHPKMHALHAMATIVAKNLVGDQIVLSDIIPHDNLISGPVYPVFPEIAERYGAGIGSYVFKAALAANVMSLEDFIAGSFQAYDTLTVGDSKKLKGKNPHMDLTMSYLQSIA